MLGGFISFVVVIALSLFYLGAFFDGVEALFGWDGWWVPAVLIPVILITGPLGTTFLVLVAGYGLYYVWGWPLWIVICLCFPSIIFMAVAATGAVVGSIYERFTRSSPE